MSIKCVLLQTFGKELKASIGSNDVIATSRFLSVAKEVANRVVLTQLNFQQHFNPVTIDNLIEYLVRVSKYIAVDHTNFVSADVSDLLRNLNLLIERACYETTDNEDEEETEIEITDEMSEEPKPVPKPTPPLLGSSCSTVSPNSRKTCCKNKTLNGSVDKWCAANYPDIAVPKPTPLPGSSCSTVSPNSRKACCKNKTLNGSVDKWCAANYPDIAPTPAPSKLCKDASNVENCCVEKALRGDFADFSCTPKKSINWLFWGGVILLLIALCIIGFFVYKRYFTSSGNISENNDNNFSNNNNNFSNNDNNFSNNNNNFNNNDNNFRNNFVADNLDKADLDILNMPAPPVKSSS